MRLMTEELERALPRLGATSDKETTDIVVAGKFFNPCGSGTWYVTEYDPESRICFGYVTGFGCDELGEFSVDELEAIKLRFGLGIERDLYWAPKTLKEVMEKR